MQKLDRQPAIKIRGLRKVYADGLEALKGIDLDIPEGSFYGLLGPNGAGKTTTIGILTGLVNITDGSAEIMGNDVIRAYRISRKLVGLAPQELNFDVFFNIRELLTLQAGYYGLSRKKSEERAGLMLRQFGLEAKGNSKARELSGGMKRRVQIAKALVHDPPIIILDEPTAGVDIELRHMLWKYLKKINEEGKTILLTTHYIEEAEQLCDTVAIIDSGRIITTGSPRELTRDHGTAGLEFMVSSLSDEFDLAPYLYRVIDGKIYVDTQDPEKDMAKVIQKISEQNALVEEVKICRSSLEDVFVKLTGKSLHEESEEAEAEEVPFDA